MTIENQSGVGVQFLAGVMSDPDLMRGGPDCDLGDDPFDIEPAPEWVGNKVPMQVDMSKAIHATHVGGAVESGGYLDFDDG